MQDLEPILLVEDDVVDAMTVRRALRELKVGNAVVHVGNGEEALAYLRDGSNPKPCLILVDINMPRMNGIELLRMMKADAELRCLPVVMLTTSTNDRDIVETFDLSVAGYMIKPVDYRQFVDTMRTINTYWRLSRRPTLVGEVATSLGPSPSVS